MFGQAGLADRLVADMKPFVARDSQTNTAFEEPSPEYSGEEPPQPGKLGKPLTEETRTGERRIEECGRRPGEPRTWNLRAVDLQVWAWDSQFRDIRAEEPGDDE